MGPVLFLLRELRKPVDIQLVFSPAKSAASFQDHFSSHGLELSVDYMISAELSGLSEIHYMKSTIATPYKITPSTKGSLNFNV